MQKERCFESCLKENEKRRHSKLDLESSTRVVSQQKQQRQAWKPLNQVQGDDLVCYNNNAFTLIELLVVVLIIGILAAVALPQYQKAVWKSRTTHLRTLQTALATAQDAYFMANGTYPTSFSELDLGFDNLTASDASTLGAVGLAGAHDTVRYNNLFEICLVSSGNQAWFRTGKYKGCGFSLNYKTKKWYCSEWHYYYKGAADSFCRKIMGAGAKESDSYNVRRYPL